MTLAISSALWEAIWEQHWLLARTLGTLILSFGTKVEWLEDGLAASLLEQRGPDAGRKQIVDRMGFPEVPARSVGRT